MSSVAAPVAVSADTSLRHTGISQRTMLHVISA